MNYNVFSYYFFFSLWLLVHIEHLISICRGLKFKDCMKLMNITTKDLMVDETGVFCENYTLLQVLTLVVLTRFNFAFKFASRIVVTNDEFYG